MARVLEGSHSFTCTPYVYPLTEWTIPAFAFPAEAGTGTHLPTRLSTADSTINIVIIPAVVVITVSLHNMAIVAYTL